LENSVKGYFSTPLTAEIKNSVTRLVTLLPDKEKCRILGPSLLREISYWVLCGSQGGALRSLVAKHTHFSRIARSLSRIHSEYSSVLDISTLAEETGMSPSAFHHHFKEVTDTSPLQYLKQIRLHKARMMLTQDGYNISRAAAAVGYNSVSQFSREFKRFFKRNPSSLLTAGNKL